MADFSLEKEEEESLIEHFLSLQIDHGKAGAQMDVQEQAPIQIPAKKTSKAFSNKRKTGINLENFWMTDFCFLSQNRHKFGRHKFGT